MVKTTSKTSKSKSKKVKVKKTTKKTARKTAKPATKKRAAKRKATKKKVVVKKTQKAAVKATKSVQAPMMFQELMGNKSNMIKLLILLVVFGAVYLLKDVFIVATVNGSPVFRWSVVSRLEEQGGRQILDSLVTEKLVNQAVKKAGVVVEQEDIDASLAEIEARLTAQGMELDQALKEQGMTRDELIEDIVLQKSVEMVVANDIEITDKEVDTYIKENKEFFPEGTDPDTIKESVREQLKSLSLGEKIQTWVQDLQDNADVLYLKEYKRAGL